MYKVHQVPVGTRYTKDNLQVVVRDCPEIKLFYTDLDRVITDQFYAFAAVRQFRQFLPPSDGVDGGIMFSGCVSVIPSFFLSRLMLLP